MNHFPLAIICLVISLISFPNIMYGSIDHPWSETDALDHEDNPSTIFQDHKFGEARLDLDRSVFDDPAPQYSRGRNNEKTGGNPPIPIDDHLHWLALGGIILFAIALKKGWFR